MVAILFELHCVNSLWPSDTIWHFPENNFTKHTCASYSSHVFGAYVGGNIIHISQRPVSEYSVSGPVSVSAWDCQQHEVYDISVIRALPWGKLLIWCKWTHRGPMMHVCFSKLTIIGSDNGLSLGRRQLPSHYLNQCWNIVDWTLGNKLQWNLNRNSYIFIQENAFENVVWKMAAILSWLQCINVHSLCIISTAYLKQVIVIQVQFDWSY